MLYFPTIDSANSVLILCFETTCFRSSNRFSDTGACAAAFILKCSTEFPVSVALLQCEQTTAVATSAGAVAAVRSSSGELAALTAHSGSTCRWMKLFPWAPRSEGPLVDGWIANPVEGGDLPFAASLRSDRGQTWTGGGPEWWIIIFLRNWSEDWSSFPLVYGMIF